MSLETTYQNDFKPYNVRYDFLYYANNMENQNQQQSKPHNWLAQCRDDIPWRRHVAVVDINGPNTVEWISTPSSQYFEPQIRKGEQQLEFDWMKKSDEKEMSEAQMVTDPATRSDYYHKVRFSPWQFVYPENEKMPQAQSDLFQRTCPYNAQSVKY